MLADFRAGAPVLLGGRRNRCWRVQVQGTERVVRRWHAAEPELRYELRVLEVVAGAGWPVPAAVGEPRWSAGAWWTLHPYLPGHEPARSDALIRGRWLAAFHRAARGLPELGPRPGWRPLHAVLGDPATDALLERHRRRRPDFVRLLEWHLHRARVRVADLDLAARPRHLIHGDFTPWNLRISAGRLSGVLDFEFARHDDPLADFALAWRGSHDDVVHGYDEVLALTRADRALLTPLWWAHLLQGACHDLRRGARDDGWTQRMLLRRSPLMGVDAVPYPY